MRTVLHWILITMKRLFGGMDQKCPKFINYQDSYNNFLPYFDIITDMGAREVMRNR